MKKNGFILSELQLRRVITENIRQLLTEGQDVVGVPFDETFKPWSREELHAMGIVSFDEAEERLMGGEDPTSIFEYVEPIGDGKYKVKLNDKCNIISLAPSPKVLMHKWVNRMGEFYDGCAMVQLDDYSYTYINTNGQRITDETFRLCCNFYDGIARVQLNDGRWTYINTNGQRITDKTYEDCGDFYDGCACVMLDDYSYTYINTNGQRITDETFRLCCNFHDGCACVQLDDYSWTDINTNGQHVNKNGQVVEESVVRVKDLTRRLDKIRQRQSIQSIIF